MASPDRSWSIGWNDKAGQFFARYRKLAPGPGEDRWGTKRLPRGFARHQKLDAERFMIAWYSAYIAGGGLNVPSPRITPATKTLRLLGPRWLQYRYEDRGTKINTYNVTHQRRRDEIHPRTAQTWARRRCARSRSGTYAVARSPGSGQRKDFLKAAGVRWSRGKAKASRWVPSRSKAQVR